MSVLCKSMPSLSSFQICNILYNVTSYIHVLAFVECLGRVVSEPLNVDWLSMGSQGIVCMRTSTQPHSSAELSNLTRANLPIRHSPFPPLPGVGGPSFG